MRNKIIYLIIALFICGSTLRGECIHESTCYDYRYLSFGTGPIVLIPNVGIGYKERHLQYGSDLSASFSTIGFAHQVSGHYVRNWYLYPETASPYFGLGVLGSAIWDNEGDGGFTLSPDFVFGKELQPTRNYRHFVDMHIAAPSLWIDSNCSWLHGPLYFPLMYIRYGVSF